MTKIAIIPARGGSRRIPRKNVMEFMGKPLIAHTIDAALESGAFDKIVVSTDDEEIAAVARTYGSEIFMRDRYADDFSNVSQAVAYTLDRLEAEAGETYDIVCQLMPNCPLRNSEDIRKGLEFFQGHDADFQISAFSFGWMNPWWAFYLENGRPVKLFEGKAASRSQDLKELYCPSGALWIAQGAALQQSRNFYGAGYKVCILDWKSAMDIDDYPDLEMAKAIYQMIHATT